MNFKIIDSEGLKYSKISGDNNPIHLDKLFGYNSIFGEKICHGCLVILKFFKITKINNIIKKNNKFSIKISFFYPSTTHIDFKHRSIYSKIKLSAEIKIKKNCSKFNIPFKTFRFPPINSKQSISLLNKDLSNLAQFINSDKNLMNKIF